MSERPARETERPTSGFEGQGGQTEVSRPARGSDKPAGGSQQPSRGFETPARGCVGQADGLRVIEVRQRVRRPGRGSEKAVGGSRGQAEDLRGQLTIHHPPLLATAEKEKIQPNCHVQFFFFWWSAL